MDFFYNLLGDTAAVVVPLVAAILGLFIAWIGARLGAFIVRKIFERANVDKRVSDSLDTKAQVTKWVTGFTFWALFTMRETSAPLGGSISARTTNFLASIFCCNPICITPLTSCVSDPEKRSY